LDKSDWQSKRRQGEGNNYEQWSIDERRGKDGCFVDRQYEYFSSGVSHHHGFLSYSSGKYVDSVAEKGMTSVQRQ
jgi:hypothetical protein